MMPRAMATAVAAAITRSAALSPKKVSQFDHNAITPRGYILERYHESHRLRS